MYGYIRVVPFHIGYERSHMDMGVTRSRGVRCRVSGHPKCREAGGDWDCLVINPTLWDIYTLMIGCKN